jgi:hypothetical protein
MLGVLIILKSLPTHVASQNSLDRICKGDHLIKDFPGIPKVLEVWYQSSQQPMSLAIAGHVGDNPSTNNNEVGGKNGQVNSLLVMQRNTLHLNFPRMDEASQLL